MGNIFSNSEGRKKFVNSVKSMTTKRDTMEKESLQNVLTTSRIALQQLERFGEAFVEQYFNTDLHSHHIAWMEHNYDWFISYQDVRKTKSSKVVYSFVLYFIVFLSLKVPKRLNETVSNPYLSALDTNSTLVKLKQLFRKAKLGLQMVMEDLYGRQDRQMGDEFLLSMEKIEGVITELQIAIQERNVITALEIEAITYVMN